jgi:hypothetical protein
MGGRKREPTTRFVDYAESQGYKIIRETSDRRRVQMRHSETRKLIIVPLYAFNAGREPNTYDTLIRRGARKGKG